MAEQLAVTEESTLLPFLISKLEGWSRKKVKQRLQGKCVRVNGKTTTQHNKPLVPGDLVDVTGIDKSAKQPDGQFDIVYRDRDLIAINKPAGLLSVSAGNNAQENALAMLRSHLSGSRRAIDLCPVHRLDKATSGILLFATSRPMREAIAATWSEAEKFYLAIVHGTLDAEKGTINQPLEYDADDKRSFVGKGQEAITHYEVVKAGRNVSLLKVTLETGRQHQIRAHMAWAGHAVVGDTRYGGKGRYLGLHASSLTIRHPRTGKTITFQAPPPKEFIALSPAPL